MFGHDRNWQLIETATSLISRAIPFAMKVGVVRNGDGRFVLIAQNNDFDAKSLEVREPAAVTLLQILDREAPLFRAICWVLLDDSVSAFLPYRLSRNAALFALKVGL
ncbi:unnamed protein product, partial [Mesorhabditis belari]|uniref:Uncharacterized protein n=1 Tax=Mesorhabditis belari TaxID=2138241 RepID=A0AAF3EXS8_9BILA